MELFPTDVRSQAHGICAATGKAGALLATLVFSYGNQGGKLDAPTIFIVSGACCLVGLVITLVFVPEVTHTALRETDRRWSVARESENDVPV